MNATSLQYMQKENKRQCYVSFALLNVDNEKHLILSGLHNILSSDGR